MDENPSKETRFKRGFIRITFSLLSFAVLTYIAIALISGRQSALFQVFGFFSDRRPVEMEDEYYFDVGRNRVFANLNDSLAAVGTLGIQVLDAGGSETLRDSFRMSDPAVISQDGRAVAFDINGTAVRAFNATEILSSIDADGAVVSASINRNGWIVVCTQEVGGSRGVITAYNAAGRVVYRVTIATGYVLSAALSPDNRSLAILNLTENGSRITFYSLNSEEVDRVFDLQDSLILDIRYLPNGDVQVVSTDSTFRVNRNNRIHGLFEFAGGRLGGFAFDGGLTALHLLDYGVGHRGRLVTLDENGNVLGAIDTDREIISISFSGGYLAILRSDRLIFFNTALEELRWADDSMSSAGASKVLALRDGAALAASDHSAVIFRIEN